MTKPLLMTPGPTYVHQDVRKAMAEEITNPDLDQQFFDFYKETCTRLQLLLKTQEDVLILDGEGILGLESACASLIEPGDRVLCLDNGIFGRGFGDFAKMYGGEVVYYEVENNHAIDPDRFKAFLEDNNDFKIATLVHCETPSGITNPIEEICPLLKEYGILTVVDSVSAIAGEELKTDEWGIDMVLGGSQKAISAPPGLTFLSISHDAWEKILNRQVPIAGYYCNLANWKNWYDKKWFPYTQPISELYGFRVAVDRCLEDVDMINRHTRIAGAVRSSLEKAGLELYPENGHSNTVTAVKIPNGVKWEDINHNMLEDHNIMIAGSIASLEGKIFRIGHMGENCHRDKVYKTLLALDRVLTDLGVVLEAGLAQTFKQIL